MTDSQKLIETFDARVERRANRRAFFTNALGAAAVGAGAFVFADAASAQTVTDNDVLNFALNLEYLEANFYSYAALGTPIPATMTGAGNTTGTVATASPTTGTNGVVYNAGARKVTFTDPVVSQYAQEIAQDELNHVNFLRGALTSMGVAQPQLDIGIDPNGAFSTAARAANIIGATSATAPTFFDPYSSDENFLLGAFIFEDVGVTAYKGAAALITNKTYLEAAAGILAVEAYHASIVRTVLYGKGYSVGGTAIPTAFGGGNYPGRTAQPQLVAYAGQISDARDSLDGSTDDDQGIAMVTTGAGTRSNIAPLDSNGLAYSRTTGQVLNVVYLTSKAATSGGFFPAGMNGNIVTSTAE